AGRRISRHVCVGVVARGGASRRRSPLLMFLIPNVYLLGSNVNINELVVALWALPLSRKTGLGVGLSRAPLRFGATKRGTKPFPSLTRAICSRQWNRYFKKGYPAVACFFKPSSLMSTPMPGLSETVINPLSIISPSYLIISLNIGSLWK